MSLEITGNMGALLAPLRRVQSEGMRRISQAASSKTLTVARTPKPGQPKRKSGALYDSIRLLDASEGGFRIGTDLIYGAVQQFGATIYPSRGERIRFSINGRWVSVASVTIKPRPFLPVSTLPDDWTTAIRSSSETVLTQLLT